MILLEKPADTAEEVLTACISGIKKVGAKPRFVSYKQELLQEISEFEEACFRGQHRTFTSGSFTETLRKDMIWLYEQRMLKAVSARPIYDRLILLAPRRVCPICHLAIANTLDHCLPKFAHPRLAVAPLNLIPVCTVCNLSKKTDSAGGINLYLDGWVDEAEWLEARVPDPSLPEVVEYFVGSPSLWTYEQRVAVTDMFVSCELPERYGVCAASEFRTIISTVRKLLSVGTLSDVKDMLLEAADSAAADRVNGWKSAAYRAWSSVAEEIPWQQVNIGVS